MFVVRSGEIGYSELITPNRLLGTRENLLNPLLKYQVAVSNLQIVINTMRKTSCYRLLKKVEIQGARNREPAPKGGD